MLSPLSRTGGSLSAICFQSFPVLLYAGVQTQTLVTRCFFFTFSLPWPTSGWHCVICVSMTNNINGDLGLTRSFMLRDDTGSRRRSLIYPDYHRVMPSPSAHRPPPVFPPLYPALRGNAHSSILSLLFSFFFISLRLILKVWNKRCLLV